MSSDTRLRLFPASASAGPAADGVDTGYWQGLREGELRLQQCAACDRWWWGPRWMCGDCRAFELSWVAVDPVGTVYSWSRTRHPFIPELAAELPYVTVLVELPQAGNRRVLGLLADPVGADDVRIGDPVRGVVQHPEGARWPALRWHRDVPAERERSR
ncbi:OB-fold domain-containing protein [Nocardia sp. NPDC052254]|uniref:Zn-ribbon domain-containing OB-fold protein n=1 Tax=Nocardia sp. NPDC052254 TaxID=3155681 RepID=UPI00343FFBF4